MPIASIREDAWGERSLQAADPNGLTGRLVVTIGERPS